MDKNLSSNYHNGKKFSNKIISIFNKYIVFLQFGIIFIFASFISPYFFTSRNLINLIRRGSIIGTLTLGQSILMLSGNLDVSVAGILLLTSVLTILLIENSVVLAILIALIVGMIFGLFNGIVVLKSGVHPFLVTLATGFIANGLVLIITQGDAIVSSLPPEFLFIAHGFIGPIPFPGVILLALLLILLFVVKYLPLGRYIYAIGGDEETARLSGIETRKIQLGLYILSGLAAGIAGILYASRVRTGMPIGAQGYELTAIAAVIIGGVSLHGGKGSIIGAILGAGILVVLANLLNLLGFSPYVHGALEALIILAAIFLSVKMRDLEVVSDAE